MARWQRVAPGDYETVDGRYRIYQVPGLRPAAWNVEAVWTDAERAACVDLHVVAVASELVVDGAASLRDAKQLFEVELPAYDALRLAVEKA